LYELQNCAVELEIKVLPVSVVVLVANMLLLFIQLMFVVVNRSTKHEQISSKAGLRTNLHAGWYDVGAVKLV